MTILAWRGKYSKSILLDPRLRLAGIRDWGLGVLGPCLRLAGIRDAGRLCGDDNPQINPSTLLKTSLGAAMRPAVNGYD